MKLMNPWNRAHKSPLMLSPHLLSINTAPIAGGTEEMRFWFCKCMCLCKKEREGGKERVVRGRRIKEEVGGGLWLAKEI